MKGDLYDYRFATPNDVDVKMFNLLNALKEQSACIDKQVSCILVDEEDEIEAVGFNHVLECDRNCHDKQNRLCVVRHAEIDALTHVNPRKYCDKRKLTAYVSLFPCVPCQEALKPYCKQIVSYGFVHKEPVFDNVRIIPDLNAELITHNGNEKQLSVAQGELAELVTAISDVFYRPEKFDSLVDKTIHLADEITDTEIMIENVKRIMQAQDPLFYLRYTEVKRRKMLKLLRKVYDGSL